MVMMPSVSINLQQSVSLSDRGQDYECVLTISNQKALRL